MPQLQFSNIEIKSISCAVPSYKQRINLDPSHEHHRYLKHYVSQIGTIERHISNCEQTCVDTGYIAAVDSLKKASVNPEEIDALIFMSQTPDFNPSLCNAFLLQYRLDLRKNILAFDVPIGCASFGYGLSLAGSLLQQDNIKKVLMISGDTRWHEYANKQELENAFYFLHGEGTTAIIFEKVTNKNVEPITVSTFCDGSGYKYLYNPKGGARNAWRKNLTNFKNLSGTILHEDCNMDGIEVTSFATTTVVDSVLSFFKDNSLCVDDFDSFILHQANKQIINSITKRLNLPSQKVPISLDRYGNTDGASVSLTICDAFSKCKKDKLRLLVCSFGVGLSWGISDLYISTKNIHPIIEVEGSQFEEGFIYPA